MVENLAEPDAIPAPEQATTIEVVIMDGPLKGRRYSYASDIPPAGFVAVKIDGGLRMEHHYNIYRATAPVTGWIALYGHTEYASTQPLQSEEVRE